MSLILGVAKYFLEKTQKALPKKRKKNRQSGQEQILKLLLFQKYHEGKP